MPGVDTFTGTNFRQEAYEFVVRGLTAWGVPSWTDRLQVVLNVFDLEVPDHSTDGAGFGYAPYSTYTIEGMLSGGDDQVAPLAIWSQQELIGFPHSFVWLPNVFNINGASGGQYVSILGASTAMATDAYRIPPVAGTPFGFDQYKLLLYAAAPWGYAAPIRGLGALNAMAKAGGGTLTCITAGSAPYVRGRLVNAGGGLIYIKPLPIEQYVWSLTGFTFDAAWSESATPGGGEEPSDPEPRKPGRRISADVFNNVGVMACLGDRIDANGRRVLSIWQNRAVSKVDSPWVGYNLRDVDADSPIGCAYLPNGDVVISYSLGGDTYYQISRRRGDKDTWSVAAATDRHPGVLNADRAIGQTSRVRT